MTRHPTPASARAVALIALVAMLAACSSSGGATASWSFGPSLEPAASGSAAPSGSAAASASTSPAASASASAPASPGASASPGGAATKLTIGTKTEAEPEFDPDSVEVPTGALVSVTFENRATIPHNLTFKDPINVATAPVVEPGASETIEFTAPAPGEYVFACSIHPGMEGKIKVE
ncbi:MAG TPA: cupredoxin domain-containing protein [Methylomirabilota bacterium]|nr:cupredoxin domain-containing protein [Methylomirabilota bacterium]